MDTLYRLGSASAAEIWEAIPLAPSYTTVRTQLNVLVEKGHVKFHSEGKKYVYEPVVPKDEMANSVIRNVLSTFFGGSVENVVAALLRAEQSTISDADLERLSKLIEEAKRSGR